MKESQRTVGVTVPMRPGLMWKLAEEARERGVSLRTWITAILIQHSGLHDGLLDEDADSIRSTVRGRKQ